jgi:DNA-binding MarR family transcriptional regulator
MAQIENQLRILEVLEKQPDTTQASLAGQLGVAVGSVNWYLKRLIRKGYVKATRMERRRLKYFVTPQGLALKARLTTRYLEASLRVYRELRQAARETLGAVRAAGYEVVAADGDGEAMEILRLTCLEEGIRLIEDDDGRLPTVRVDGVGFAVTWPEREGARAVDTTWDA